MPNTVNVNARDIANVLWLVRSVSRHVATWGSLVHLSRQRIELAVLDVNRCLGGLATLSGTVEVEVSKMRAAITFLERLTSAVHSARAVMTSDRRRALGIIASTKRKLVSYVQLKLFET